MTLRPLLRARIVVGLAVSALLVSGCASSSDSGSSNKAATKSPDQLVSGLINVDDSGTPVKGGTLTIAEYSEARSMNPVQTYSNGAAGGSALLAVYDSLMRYDWTEKKFVPRLAESLETSDNTTWTLKLRDGVKFSDDTPLDADAVVDSIDYYTKNYGYGSLQWLSNVESTKKVDDSTIEFKTRLPWGSFPDLLAHGPGLIMAPAAYQDPANFKPIGAGPFTFASYATAESLILKANDAFWDGRPNLDQLKFVWPGGDEAKVEALENGDVDSAYLRDDKLVTKEMAKNAPGMRWVIGQGRNVWINVRKDRDTAIPEVRKALQLAWSPETYLKRNGEDVSLATSSLMPTTSEWHTGVQGPEQDLTKAKELVEQAKKNGFDGTLEYAHFADPVSTKMAVTAKAILESAGFKIELRGLKSVADQIKMMYTDHNFDLAVSAVTIPDEDPYLRLAGVTSPNSPTNSTGYDNPELNKLVAELAAATGPADGKATLTKIEEVWQADAPSLPVSTGLWMQPWSEKVHGINPTTENMLFYDKAWVTK